MIRTIFGAAVLAALSCAPAGAITSDNLFPLNYGTSYAYAATAFTAATGYSNPGESEGTTVCSINAIAGSVGDGSTQAVWTTLTEGGAQITLVYFEGSGQGETSLSIMASGPDGTKILPAPGTYTLLKTDKSPDAQAPASVEVTIQENDYSLVQGTNFLSTCYADATPKLTVDATGTGKGTTTGTDPSTIACSADAGVETGTCQETVEAETVVVLTAAADANSVFTGWTGCNAASGENDTVCTMTMSASATVQPNFDLAPRKLTVEGAGAGNGSVAGSIGGGGIGEAMATVPSGNIDCTSTAGAESGACSLDLADGGIVTLTATPAEGSFFAGWTGCDSENENVCTQTVTGGNETVTASFGLPTGTLTVVKHTGPKLAGDGTFGFSSPEPELDGLSLTTVNGTATSSDITLTSGTYELTEDEHEGWRLDDLQCTGDEDNGSVISVADRKVTIDLDGGEAITCTFTNVVDEDYVVTRTQGVIHNFLTERADMITANDPDLERRLTRRGVQTGGGNPLAFAATGGSGNYDLSYSTSLSAIASAFGSPAGTGYLTAYGPDGADTAAAETTRPGFDMWIEGSYSHADSGTAESNGGLLYVGADYLVSPGLLVGVLGQFDWMKQTDDTVGTAVEGQGWMVGPYMVARLQPNLVLDARAAWGQSDNDVDPFGLYTDSFETDRWLARARLTGDFKSENWTFSPKASLIYFEERQKAYVDSFDITIPEQTVSLGRMTFGPRIGYVYKSEDGTVIEPYLELEGIWDFDKAEIVDLGSGLAAGSSEELRARIEGGFTARMANGWSFTGEGFYDGIGADDLDVYGGKARITIPLN